MYPKNNIVVLDEAIHLARMRSCKNIIVETFDLQIAQFDGMDAKSHLCLARYFKQYSQLL